jgi:exonuclease VII small subunit
MYVGFCLARYPRVCCSVSSLFDCYFVYVDQVLDQRVQSLERELDAAISAAARARTEKRQAEAAQRAAEQRAQDVTKELENTSSTCTVLLAHQHLTR